MQRVTVTVPDDLFGEARMTWDIDWRGQGVGESNSGVTRTVYNAFPRWVGQPEVFMLPPEILRWRAIRGAAQGALGIYRMRMVDPVGFSRFDIAGGGNAYPTGIPFSNGQPFSSGFGFRYDPFVMAAADALAGASTIQIDVSGAGVVPNPGQFMSHNDWPFLVVYVQDDGAGLYTLGIQMPLRSAMTAGDLVLLNATGLFEAAEENMGNPIYGQPGYSAIKLTFREVLVR